MHARRSTPATAATTTQRRVLQRAPVADARVAGCPRHGSRSSRGQDNLAPVLAHSVQARAGRTGDRPSGGSHARRVLQRYTEQRHTDGARWRLSDDGTVATKNGDSNHQLYALAGKVEAANDALATVGSGITLEELTQQETFLRPDPPNPAVPVTLNKVEAWNSQNGTHGDAMRLYADCGRSAAVVVGGAMRRALYTRPEYGEASETSRSAPTESPTLMKIEIMKAWLQAEQFVQTDIDMGAVGRILACIRQGEAREAELVQLRAQHAAERDPGQRTVLWARCIKMENTVAEAYFAYYNSLDGDARGAIDEALKINAFANPAVGQGYTMSSGGAPHSGQMTWFFHWAGVVMTSDDDADKVVIENYSVGDRTVQNEEWTFDIYGTRDIQTFDARHYNTRLHGESPTTMTIEKA